jgi:hypothetical protein
MFNLSNENFDSDSPNEFDDEEWDLSYSEYENMRDDCPVPNEELKNYFFDSDFFSSETNENLSRE